MVDGVVVFLVVVVVVVGVVVVAKNKNHLKNWKTAKNSSKVENFIKNWKMRKKLKKLLVRFVVDEEKVGVWEGAKNSKLKNFWVFHKKLRFTRRYSHKTPWTCPL